MDVEQEVDINDVFDSIAFSERDLHSEGFQEGFMKGKEEGKFDGFHLGYHRGLQVGYEIGFYKGVVKEILDNRQSTSLGANEKVTEALKKMEDLLQQFPDDNLGEIDLIALMSEIRAAYKNHSTHDKMSAKIVEVRAHLESLLTFFEPLKGLANAHFGSLLAENLSEMCKRYLPKGVQEDLSDGKSIGDFLKTYCDILNGDPSTKFAHSNLAKFLHAIKTISLNLNQSHVTSPTSLHRLLRDNGGPPKTDFKLSEFMSPKKLHEVREMSKVTAMVSDLTDSSHVVDVGGGKGYLGTVLVLQHSCRVLGLDLSEVKTCGAVRSSGKIARIWQGGVFDGNDSDLRKTYLGENLKLSVVRVTPETDIRKAVQDEFGEGVRRLTLSGLHTCGNLSSTCLRLFLKNRDVASLVNVGCCYHLLSEEFSGEDDVADDHGFPMSEFLRSRNFALGRNARMLASHSLDKMQAKTELDDYSFAALFHRAILETIVKAAGERTSDQKIGKLARKCSNFHEYLSKAVKKLDLNVEVTEEYSARLYTKYLDEKPLFMAFYLLRVSLAPVIESIILLDRFLFLLENGINHVYLVKLFNLEISPRGFGLIAWKDDQKNS